MHNLSVFKCSDGSIRIRFFNNHVFDHDYHKPKPPKKIYTPFFDKDNNYEQCYGYEILSDQEIEFKKQESIRCSISRTHNKVLKIALSGDFDYFATFTFNKDFVDRYSYDDCCKVLQSWLHTLVNVQYIVVPEEHKDGAYHFHGLFSKVSDLVYVGGFKIGDVYHSRSINFGYHSFVPIRNRVKSARYICKYITKTIVSVPMYRKRYWYSRSNINVGLDISFLVQKNLWRYFLNNYKQKESFYYENKVCFIEYNEVWFSSDFADDIISFFECNSC